MAVYDPFIKAPRCNSVGDSCDTRALLAGVGAYEVNAPNTVDGCQDNSPAYIPGDEAIERIVIRSKDGGNMAAGKMLVIEAIVATASDVSGRTNIGYREIIRFYHASTSSAGWVYIAGGSVLPGSGMILFRYEKALPEGGIHAIRVKLGYGESSTVNPCSNSSYSTPYIDVDDMVFEIAAAEETSDAPSSVPSVALSVSPSVVVSALPSMNPR